MPSECTAFGRFLPEAYHNALSALRKHGKEYDCPAWNTKQLECGMTMIVGEAVREPMISKFFPGGAFELEQYRQEMLDGILDFEVDAGKWDYTYHRRMTAAGVLWRDQIQFVVDELRNDPQSRRAVIDIRDADTDMYSADPACLQHIQFTIRDGMLNMYALFRSNDAVKATFMNAFALIMLQQRIADELDIPVGGYVHRVNSFHCYERDYSTLNAYADKWDNRGKMFAIGDFAYNYEGFYEELMNEEKPRISEKVKVLKERVFGGN